MTANESKVTLVEGLRLLASPAKDQITCLPEYVDICHEVISGLTEPFLQLPTIIESEAINYPAIAAILRCYNWVDYISRQDMLLQLEALKTHEAWQKARLLAQKALLELGEKMQKPNLQHIRFVED